NFSALSSERRRRRFDMELHQLEGGTRERRLARDHLVRDDAQAIYVAARVKRLTAALLRRHVYRGAENRSDSREPVCGNGLPSQVLSRSVFEHPCSFFLGHLCRLY